MTRRYLAVMILTAALIVAGSSITVYLLVSPSSNGDGSTNINPPNFSVNVISEIVRDSFSLLGIANASVFVDGNYATHTTEWGLFVCPLTHGQHVLRFDADGYLSEIIQVDVHGNSSQDIYLDGI